MERRKKRDNPKRFNMKMQANLLLVFCVVITLFVVLIFRILYIKKYDGERYKKKVLSQQTYMSNEIPYQRGTIVDRNETVLAKSEKIYNLVFDPKFMLSEEAYKEPTLKLVTQSFDIAYEEAEKILNEQGESRYIVVKKDLPYDAVQKFKEAMEKDKNIKGVRFEEDFKRVYPMESLACDVIGFTNSKGAAGIGGIEGYYNDELTGSNGREYGYFDADLNLERTVKPAVNGHTIVSTLDANVQGIVEKHIAKFNEEIGSLNTAVVVMNPQNGEIYAMASEQPFDLNNPWDLSPFYSESEINGMTDKEKDKALNDIWRNFCVSDAYEPGSTFKPVTVAMALEEALTTENSTFVCDKVENIAGTNISCNARHNTIDLPLTLMKSCNSAMMQLSGKIGRSSFSKYQRLFGFGSKTGIDLPGETTGLVFSEEKLNPVELATSSFGQGETVSMLQIAAAISSIINGGYYYEPHVVKDIRNENRASVKTIEPVLVRETVSAQTSEQIKKYLDWTVSDDKGTGKAARIPGYEIGGKTGTAEKAGRDKKNYLVSFLGFTPVEEPKVLVYALIDQPNVEKQDRSIYAIDLCRDIMEEILPFLDVYRAEVKETDTGEDKKDTPAKTPKPDKKTEENHTQKEDGGPTQEPQEDQKETGSPAPPPDPEGTEGNSGQDQPEE